MHVQSGQDFAKWLRELGQGSLNDENDDVILPPSLRCSTNDVGGLIDHVYHSIHTSHPDDYFKQRCILAPRDGEVHETNKIVLERFPGPLFDAWSVNEAYKPQTKILFEDIAIEDLHVISPPGFPLAHLSLKVGCPVVFLRDVSEEVPKGSRGIVTKTGVRVMEVRLLNSGEIMLVPRIPHEIEVTADLPFGREKIRLRRLQFPVALGFAMTIDNAQGQTFSTVGVDLRSPCFAHGQLYLALSRASRSAGIKCIVGTHREEGKTKNIVYREVVEVMSQASSHRPPTHARSE